MKHLVLHFACVLIKEVNSHKHLGLYLTTACDWLIYLEYIQEIILLRSLRFTIKLICPEKICVTFIRSILEYVNIVWDYCTKQLRNEFEKILLEAEHYWHNMRGSRKVFQGPILTTFFFTFLVEEERTENPYNTKSWPSSPTSETPYIWRFASGPMIVRQ